MPAEAQLTARDATYAMGRPGIAAFAPSSGEAIFRFVHVADTHLGSVPGDFSFDMMLSVDDIDELSFAIRDGHESALFDVNSDGNVGSQNLAFWVHDLKTTWLGDANLSGEFNSSDLIDVFQAGEYEDATENNSSWAEGDWDADGDFTTGDLIVAFQDGGYEMGSRQPFAVVPEPASVHLLALVVIVAAGFPKIRRRTI